MDACFQLKRYKKKGENTEVKPYSLDMEEKMYKKPEVVAPYEKPLNSGNQREDKEEVMYIVIVLVPLCNFLSNYEIV